MYRILGDSNISKECLSFISKGRRGYCILRFWKQWQRNRIISLPFLCLKKSSTAERMRTPESCSLLIHLPSIIPNVCIICLWWWEWGCENNRQQKDRVWPLPCDTVLLHFIHIGIAMLQVAHFTFTTSSNVILHACTLWINCLLNIFWITCVRASGTALNIYFSDRPWKAFIKNSF